MSKVEGITLRLTISGLRFRGSPDLTRQEMTKRIIDRLSGDDFVTRLQDDRTKPEAKKRLRTPVDIQIQIIPEIPDQLIRAAGELESGSPFVIVTKSGGVVNAKIALSLFGVTVKDAEELVPKLDQIAPALNICGRVSEIKIEGKTYEVVAGLKATPEIKEVVESAIGDKKYSINKRGMIVNVTPGDAQEVLKALNQKYPFGLDFVSSGNAVAIARKWQESFIGKGILWCWTRADNSGELEEFIMYAKFANKINDQNQRDEEGGLVFARPKP